MNGENEVKNVDMMMTDEEIICQDKKYRLVSIRQSFIRVFEAMMEYESF